jgi:transcriptional regulator with XRE-family HTH domain
MTSTGSRVKELRLALKLRQKDFAEGIGLTQGALSAIECGKNPLTAQSLLAIRSVFNANTDWLKTGEGSMFDTARTPDKAEAEFLAIFRSLPSVTQDYVLESLKAVQRVGVRRAG